MENTLRDILNGKIVIIGIGNVLRADDGFGPALIERLYGKVHAVCIDAQTAPENYLIKVIKEEPDTVVILDAVHLGKDAGEYQILKKDEILKSGFTTHDISASFFIEFLERETNANIYLLGVQPASVVFGETMSESVRNTLDELEWEIRQVI